MLNKKADIGDDLPDVPTSINDVGGDLPSISNKNEKTIQEVNIKGKTPQYNRSKTLLKSYPEVKELQKQIQLLVSDITESDLASKTPKSAPRENDEQNNYLGGASSFIRFLIDNYISPKSEEKGNEFVNTPQNTQERIKNQIPDYNLVNILSTIKTLGKSGTEGAPDGVWYERTNNALLNIGKIFYAFLSLAKDLGLDIQGYALSDLEKFNNSIPKSNEDIIKLGNKTPEWANAFTNEIKKMRAFYANFKEKVFENPELKPFIYQQKPFSSYQKFSGNQISAYDQKIINSSKTDPVPGLELQISNKIIQGITLNDLISIDNFKKMLERNGIQAQNLNINPYVKLLKQKLNEISALQARK